MATMLEWPTTMQQTLLLLTNLFPVWVIMFVCVGLVPPRPPRSPPKRHLLGAGVISVVISWEADKV